MGHILNNAHGSDEDRRAAFLEGYYGGANLCASLGELGAAKPLPGARVIKAVSLVPPAGIASGKGRLCTWASGPAGLRVRNSAASGSCKLDLLANEAQLPDHVRIELTVNRASAVAAGLYFGDAHSMAGPTRYGLEVRQNSLAQLVHIDNDAMIDIFQGLTSFIGRSKINALGENHLTLDIHHEGSDVYFVECINGLAAGFGHWPGVLPLRLGTRDEVGVWLRDPGTEAIFKDLRVTTLFN